MHIDTKNLDFSVCGLGFTVDGNGWTLTRPPQVGDSLGGGASLSHHAGIQVEELLVALGDLGLVSQHEPIDISLERRHRYNPEKYKWEPFDVY